MPGSAETLPAGFRLTATSGHSRRLPPEGKCTSFLTHDTFTFLKPGFQTKHRLCLPVEQGDESISPGSRSSCPCCVWGAFWLCLLFSLTLWRLLCSPLWGAGWQSWRHVFGLVSRSAHLKVLGLLALRVLILLFVVLVYIYSLLFTWSLPTTVLLYLSFSLWSLTLASLFSFYN